MVAKGDPAGWDEKEEFTLGINNTGDKGDGATGRMNNHSMSFRDIAEAAEEFAAAQLSAQLRRIRATLAALDDATVDALTETASERAPPPPEVAAELAETLAMAAAELSAAAKRIHASTKPQPLPPPPAAVVRPRNSGAGSTHGELPRHPAAAAQAHSAAAGKGPHLGLPPPHPPAAAGPAPARAGGGGPGESPHTASHAQMHHTPSYNPFLQAAPAGASGSQPSSPSRKVAALPGALSGPGAHSGLQPLSAPMPAIVQRRPSLPGDAGAVVAPSSPSSPPQHQQHHQQPSLGRMNTDWAGGQSRHNVDGRDLDDWSASAAARAHAPAPMASGSGPGLLPPPPAPAVSMRRISGQEAAMAQHAAAVARLAKDNNGGHVQDVWGDLQLASGSGGAMSNYAGSVDSPRGVTPVVRKSSNGPPPHPPTFFG